MNEYFKTALKLHQYLLANHWDGDALIGPDPGVRFNYRIGRFLKSYLRRLKWNDDYYYLQAQGYWVLANWALFREKDDKLYAEIAIRSSETMLKQQRKDGAWDYPNREWRGRVATAEGAWAAIGLLETYRHTSDPRFLDGASSWHRYLLDGIRFQQIGDELAINYFAGSDGVRVPNNSITVLRFLAELAEATNDRDYLSQSTGILNFLKRAQKPSGEFPYSVAGINSDNERSHFQCFQYNAFECLNLMRYHDLTGDDAVLPMIDRLLSFLSHGLARNSYAFYDCKNRSRTVTYHTTVLATVFAQAGRFGFDGYESLAKRAYDYVSKRQRPDGSFWHSQRDYYLLNDRRSYPRYLAMMLYHFLVCSFENKNETHLEYRFNYQQLSESELAFQK